MKDWKLTDRKRRILQTFVVSKLISVIFLTLSESLIVCASLSLSVASNVLQNIAVLISIILA